MLLTAYVKCSNDASTLKCQVRFCRSIYMTFASVNYILLPSIFLCESVVPQVNQIIHETVAECIWYVLIFVSGAQ